MNDNFTRREAIAAIGGLAFASSSLLGAMHAAGFEPEIGVCRGPGAAAVAKGAGVAYLEVGCRSELKPDKPESEATESLRRLKALSVPARAANNFLPGSFQATGPKADHEPILRYAEVAFRRAAEVGLEIITFGSSGARSLPEGYPIESADLQLVSLLGRMADRAARHGVTVCVEPLRHQETNYINRVSHATRLVGAIDHPSVGITADIYHMLVEDENADSILKAGKLIKHVHIAEERDRRAPGTSGEDFASYLGALKQIGYEGRISIECRWDAFEDEVAGSVRELRGQLKRA